MFTFISMGFYPALEEELKEYFEGFEGEEKGIEDFRKQATEGFAATLRTTQNQIRAVFIREGVVFFDIAFLIVLEKEKFHVEIFAFPVVDVRTTDKDQLTLLFPLLEKQIVIPLKKPLEIKYESHGYSFATEAGQRLAADFGREGLPADMRKIIVEMSKIFKRAKSPKYYPYPHWMKV